MFSLALLFCCSYLVQSSHCVIVVTKLGAVEGVDYVLEDKRTIHAFLGVPYAKPPIVELRFEEPQPVEKWEGTWKAKASSSPCLQIFIKMKGSEDCLYLDIYTPTVSRDSALPVVFFIHGGAFRFGSGESAQYILSEANFIFVPIHYRLGPFGFLSTEDNLIPGNNGLKDQVMALKWVENNIESFGGDKNKVTIVGSSAGGASVHLHYLSPMSRGLFRNGISVSGTALNPWALTENPLEKARMLAASVGCPTTPSVVMVKCLKHRPGEQFFLNFSSIFMPWYENPFTPFGPVIERAGNNFFLNEHPYQILSEGRVQDKPWLLSVTTEEGLYPAAIFIEIEEAREDLQRNWNKISPLLLDYNYTVKPERVNQVSEKIRDFYFGKDGPNVNDIGAVINILSDRLFKTGIAEAAILQASVMKSPVYLYSIGYRFNVSFTDYFTKRKYGVSHADGIINLLEIPFNDENMDKTMILILRNIWFSFMSSGVPSTGQKDGWEPLVRYEKHNIRYLNIKSPENIIMSEEVDFGNKTFWNSLGLNENGYFNDTVTWSRSDERHKLSAIAFILYAIVLAVLI